MNYYSKLLATAFRALTNEQSPACLALTYSAIEQSGDHGSKSENPFRLLSESLPQNSEIRFLSGGELSLEESIAIAASSEARCAFIHPPILGEHRYSNEWRERHGAMGYPEAIASYLMKSSDGPDGCNSNNDLEVLVMLVPSNFASSMRTSRWRNEFFLSHSAVVIEHEHAEFAPHLGLSVNSMGQFTTVIFQRNPGPIRFFKISEAALADGAEKIVKDLGQLLRQPAGKTRYGYVYQGLLDDGYPCSYDYYSAETERLRQEVSVLGAKVPLSSVADVRVGIMPLRPNENYAGHDGILAISGSDITLDGRVNLSEPRTFPKPSYVSTYLQDGDFCVRVMTANNGNLVVGVYESDGRPITASTSVIIVRPHPTLTPAQRQVLLAFLRSQIGYRLADAQQSFSKLQGVIRISTGVLKDFPVPLADEELSASIEQLNAAKTAFLSWIEQIERESNAMIEEATAVGSRERILSAGRLARQRHRAGQQVEELDYRVRTQFPYPLAYAWRKLQVAGNDRYHRLDAVLQAAESHTCFMALVAILISRSVNQPIKWVDEIAKRLSGRKSGTNFGDWLAILQELNEAKAFRPHKGTMPFAEVAEVYADKAWSAAITKLKIWRDDDCHGRISTRNVPATLLKEAEDALEQVYRATEFLTDYRFLFIVETRFDSIRKINRYHYLDLTGDNTLAQRREDLSDRADLESQSLYLKDRQGQLHLFRPLLHYLECPECHLMSTFYLDTFGSNESGEIVGLKSFETNSVRHERVAEEFRHIGLLPSKI